MSRLTTTRSGTLVVGALAAGVAAVLIFVFLNQYRSSVDKQNQKISVLVAKSLIVKGTPGDLVGSKGLFQVSDVTRREAKPGTLVDPSAIRGRIAVADIFPGQALTAADFAARPSDNLSYKITGNMRAVAVPLDSAHGLAGILHTGDHVDITAGFNVVPVDTNGAPVTQGGQTRPVTRTIMQDVLVLNAPAAVKSGIGAAASSTSNIVLRLTDSQAAIVAFASDNGKLWLSLRPQNGAAQATPTVETVETVLLGVPAIKALVSLGGKH